jgi:hypothetical protein
MKRGRRGARSYREADDDASGEDEGPPAANLRRASVAVVADDGLHLPTESMSTINPGIGSKKMTGRTITDPVVILLISILSYPSIRFSASGKNAAINACCYYSIKMEIKPRVVSYELEDSERIKERY